MFKLRVYIKALAAGLFIVSLAMSQYNTIDAVTQATIQLKSGKAYATYAVVTWQDDYNNGTSHLIKYGINSVDENSFNLKPFAPKQDITDTLSPLVRTPI